MALSDSLGMIASSYKIVRHNEEYDRLLDEVQVVVEEKKVDAIVLGLPKNMNNTIGPKGELSFQFKEKLENKLNIPVYLQDERLTTRQAESLLINNDTSRKKRKKVIDSMAATIILQSYLDRSK
jgi:putative Holliday junction resolvase